MQNAEFRKYAHQMADWIADYFQHIGDLPVMSQAKPKEIFNQLPENPPDQKRSFEECFLDFQKIILPGITHWQHPRFFAYFPANVGYPAILAEMLTAALGVQGMLWQTSPAATELEERVMLWLRDMLGLPRSFTGVIQDSASGSTLCSILTAREQKTGYASNRSGLFTQTPFIVYCSTETHSSIEKAVKIAGLGSQNLRRIPVDRDFAMLPDELRKTIEEDRRKGLKPLCVVATLGTTGSTALDPLQPIGLLCKEQDLWLHVDAAYAGTALLLPETRTMLQGIEMADSFVFNPHKWMFTGLDCSAYFVQNPAALVRTLEILPEYLKTSPGDRVNNYRDWGLGLGRRFRALKLWLVISTFGVQGLREIIRSHMAWARELTEMIQEEPDFELLAPMPFSTLCFRYKPSAINDLETLNRLNAALLAELNVGGYLYISHTKLHEIYTLRFAIGQTYVTRADVQNSWSLIKQTARDLVKKFDPQR